ncbi:hypothetical protein OFC38_35035, partial [Escherichia coli]|nr:hypothetical protein [Escherichia coli]
AIFENMGHHSRKRFNIVLVFNVQFPKHALEGRKKKKGSDDEAFEDSDDGDFEGQEVDYMSDGSSSSPDEAEGKPKVPQQ